MLIQYIPIYIDIYIYTLIHIDPIWSYKCFDNFKYLILRLCMDIYWVFTFKPVQSSVVMEFAPCEFTSDIKMSCGSHPTLFLPNSTSACRNRDVLWIRLEFLYFRSHMLVFPLFGGGIQFLSLNHSGRLTSAGCLCQILWNTIWIGASIQSSNHSTISLNCNVIASSLFGFVFLGVQTFVTPYAIRKIIFQADHPVFGRLKLWHTMGFGSSKSEPLIHI